MNYFVICVSEDGDVSVEQVSKEELERRFDEEYYGPVDVCRSDVSEKDPMYWGPKRILVIKGEIVVPRVAEIVTKVKVN